MDLDRCICFDVETPNSRNHRMSAIGIAVVQDGEIIRDFYTLVNPETSFDAFNIQLTGIDPDKVRSKPTFPVLWELIAPWMDSGVLVAHNAAFDMSVLAKCLRDYDIPFKPRVSYACTCQMGRRLLPGMPNHRLNTLCDALGFELDHHNALSDARACAMLLLHYQKMGATLRPFLRTYDMEEIRTVSSYSSYRRRW